MKTSRPQLNHDGDQEEPQQEDGGDQVPEMEGLRKHVACGFP